MGRRDEDYLPEDLSEVGERLWSQRTEAPPWELDEKKRRVKARARRARAPSGVFGRTRRTALTVTLMAALVASGSGVVIATGGGSPRRGETPSKHEYKPGKGCGDKNDKHDREGECKKQPPK